jgi:hypothetical protein
MFLFTHLSWSSVYPVGLYLLIVLIFGLCVIPLLRRLPRTVPPPLVVAPESARRHLAVIYLIRAGEGVILLPFLIFVAVIGYGFLMAFFPHRSAPARNEGVSFVMLPAILLICAAVVVGAIRRFRKSGFLIFTRQKLEDVSEDNIGTFSFVFAAFAAHDFYRLMPPAPAKILPGFVGMLNRDFMWIVVFWVLWKGTKVLLSRLLELNPPSSRQSPPDDPDIPEFPQKSPLLPL